LAVVGEVFEDFVCGLGPDEGFGVGVPGVDPAADVGFEGGDAAVGEAAEFAVGESPLLLHPFIVVSGFAALGAARSDPVVAQDLPAAAVMCPDLLARFAEVSNGRSDQGRVHPVAVVLALCAAAVVAGMGESLVSLLPLELSNSVIRITYASNRNRAS
jgi:hypothetical protein